MTSEVSLSVGSDGLVSELQPLASVLQSLPTEVGGLRRHVVSHSCMDVSLQYLAVGSEQGYVWVVDTMSGRLLRELNEFQGTSVTAVKLNQSKHGYIAYGTSEGIVRVENITKLMTKKHTMRDREGRPVSSLSWDHDGKYLYCGFVSGRLLQFLLDQWTMEVTPLLDCGSAVVQLSVSGYSLLISTLARSLLLEVNTGRWTQVGTKERKVAPYGGSFSNRGEKAYLTRPGLRVWTADRNGKVLCTAKFRDALSASRLPSIPSRTWPSPSGSLEFSDSWQFTLVHTWLNRFMVTFQNNFLWVLDTENVEVAGMLAVKHKITCVATCGNHIYVLCGKASKPLARFTIHPSFSLARDEDGVGSIENVPQKETTPDGGEEGLQEVPLDIEVNIEPSERTLSETQPPSRDGLVPEPNKTDTSPPQEVSSGGVRVELREMFKPALGRLTNLLPRGKGRRVPVEEQEEDRREEVEVQESQKKEFASDQTPGVVVTPVESNAEPQEPHRELNLKDVLKLSKLLHGGEATPPDTPPTVHSSPAISSEEQARRLRMTQAGDEEEVVVTGKSHKKKRKKKTKKVSSKCSSTSNSLERLTDIAADHSNFSLPAALLTLGDGDIVPEEHPSELTTSDRLDTYTLASNRLDTHALASNRLDTHALASDRLDTHALASNRLDTHALASDRLDTHTLASDQLDTHTLASNRLDTHTLASDRLDTHTLNSDRLDVHTLATGEEVTDEEVTGEHQYSEEVVIAVTAEGENDQETQQLIYTGQRERTADGSSRTPTHTSNRERVVQATDQEGFLMVDTSREMDSLQFVTEDRRGLAEKGGRLSSEEDLLRMVMFEDSSLLESVVDSPLHSHAATPREPSPNIDQEMPLELSDDPLYLNETSTAESSLSGSKSDPKSHTSSASIDIKTPKPTEKQSVPPPHRLLSSSDPSGRGDPFTGFSQSPECSTSIQPLGYSLSVESKRKTMSPTPERDEVVREGGAEVSDSSHDSDTDSRHSVVVSDYYKLCGTLVQSSSQKTRQQQQQSMKGRLAAFPHRRDSTSSTESLEDVSQQETVAGADIWVPIPHPSRTHLRSVCLSEELLWVVDIRGMVFCTTTESKGRDWQMIQRSMEQITSSSSGKIVWGLHHQNAYVRLGIGMNPAGSTWRNMTKGTTIAHKIKHIAADEKGVWAIKIDGQVLFRKGVTEGSPEGRVWQEVGHPAGFTHVACCNETIWAITSSGKVFIRDGITPAAPSGKKWIDVKAPKLMMVTLTSNGVVWGVDQESQMGFRCGITQKRAQGKGPWWEVSISALTHPSSPYNSLWQVMSTELGGSQLLASLPPSVSSLVTSHPVHHKLVAISASAKVGVVVLEAGSRLHACWRSATGYHYTSACKDGVFQLTTWIKLVVGSTALWLVRDDGELYCLTREDKLIRIECSGDISMMAASPSVLWAVFNDIVWSRQGMTPEVPEGISWDYIELSTLLQERKLRHIACGNRAVWAIDSTGVPHFRFGVHAREPGTGMSPAWVPVEDNPDPLYRITVSPDDWLVWACGENYNVYVRTAVTQDFPVGTAWELVQGERAKELCASSGKVYALTPGGDLLCRFGITESNLQGNYWRRMPGKYAHISTSPSGDLWTLDEKGQVWKQECKAIAVSQDPGASRSELEMSMVVDHTWEVV